MYRPRSSMSKTLQERPSTTEIGAPITKTEYALPQLDSYIKARDWVGAIAHLENDAGQIDFKNYDQLMRISIMVIIGKNDQYIYRKAINVYDQLMKQPDYDKRLHLYKACCYYALFSFDEAKREAARGPENSLSDRLLLHIAHKKNDEKNLMLYHNRLDEGTENQLSIAAIHYLRGHYDEASEIYKRLRLESRESQAINVYIALCYHKQEYITASEEILQSYLSLNPTSVIAVNLKACNQFADQSGKAAEEAYKPLQKAFTSGNLYDDNDLLRHNIAVFSNGDNALSIWPQMVDVLPEARLNLIIHHLRNEELQQAFALAKDIEPSVPREYIIKAIAYASLGQQTENKEYLKIAQNLFQLVGSSAAECDTIPGRQCMASCFFLLKQYDDVLVYLNSIKQYFESDDDFHWNYGLTKAQIGEYQAAQESFSQILNPKYRKDENLVQWQVRTYIYNGLPKQQFQQYFRNAWEIYERSDNPTEQLTILQIIANDCYKMGQFYYAAKAFDILSSLEDDLEYDEAMRGSVIGVFQQVVAGQEKPEHLSEVLTALATQGSNPQIEYTLKVINKWAKEANVKLQ